MDQNGSLKRIKLEDYQSSPMQVVYLPEHQQLASTSVSPHLPVISQCYSVLPQIQNPLPNTKQESSDNSSASDSDTDKQLEQLSMKFYKEKLKSKEKKWKKFKKEKESIVNENKRLSLEVDALREENHRLLLENYTLRHQTTTNSEINRSSETLEFVLQPNGDRFYTKFDITLTKYNVTAMESIPLSSKYDSKFVYKLLEQLFPNRDELAYSSATGRTSKNPNYVSQALGSLDCNRLEFTRAMYRVRILAAGDTDEETTENRLKKFNHYVNVKIQNTRRQRAEVKDDSTSNISGSEYSVQE